MFEEVQILENKKESILRELEGYKRVKLTESQQKNKDIDELNMKEFWGEIGEDKQKLNEYLIWVANQPRDKANSIEYYKLKKGGCLYF